MTDKYQAACIEYAGASKEVKRLTKAIGNQSLRCFEANGDTDQEHLKKAYKISSDGFDPYYGCYELTYEHHDGCPESYLLETCEHCHKSHLLIQERKEARKRFGVAKRRISVLGRTQP